MIRIRTKSKFYRTLEETDYTTAETWIKEAERFITTHPEIIPTIETLKATIRNDNKHYSIESRSESNYTCAICLVPRIWCNYCETIHKPIHQRAFEKIIEREPLCNKCSITIRLFQRCPHKETTHPPQVTNRTKRTEPTAPIRYNSIRRFMKKLDPFKKTKPHPTEDLEEIVKDIPAASMAVNIAQEAEKGNHTYIKLEDIINPNSDCHTGKCLACEFTIVWCKRCETLHNTLIENLAPGAYTHPNTCNICRIHMDALANCPEYEQHVYRQARKGIHLEVQPILTEDDNYYFKVLKEQLLEEAYAKLEKWPLKRKLYIEMIEIYDATRRSNNIKTSEPAKVIDFAKTKCNFCHIELKWCVNCKQIHKAIEGKTLQGLKVPERACVRCQEHTTRAQTCSWSPSRNQIHLPLPDVVTTPGYNTIPAFTDENCTPVTIQKQTQQAMIKALPINCQHFNCIHLMEAIETAMDFNITLAMITKAGAEKHLSPDGSTTLMIAYYQHLKTALDKET